MSYTTVSISVPSSKFYAFPLHIQLFPQISWSCVTLPCLLSYLPKLSKTNAGKKNCVQPKDTKHLGT